MKEPTWLKTLTWPAAAYPRVIVTAWLTIRTTVAKPFQRCHHARWSKPRWRSSIGTRAIRRSCSSTAYAPRRPVSWPTPVRTPPRPVLAPSPPCRTHRATTITALATTITATLRAASAVRSLPAGPTVDRPEGSDVFTDMGPGRAVRRSLRLCGSSCPQAVVAAARADVDLLPGGGRAVVADLGQPDIGPDGDDDRGDPEPDAHEATSRSRRLGGAGARTD